MPSLSEVRQKYPQYNDLSDDQLADSLYRKFYSDMPRADFDAKIGRTAAPAEVAAPTQPAPLAPSTPQAPAIQESPEVRGLKIGTQGSARGIADLLGAPVDLMTAGMNLPMATADFIASKFGGSVPYRIRNPVGGSDHIADTASRVAGVFGYEPVEPQGLKEELAYNANRFGVNALASAYGLSRAAATRGTELLTETMPKWYDAILRPYLASPAKAVASDAAAGVGAGVGLTATQQLPDSVRNKGDGAVGTIADYIAMLVGGVGAGTTANLALNGPQNVVNSFKGRMTATDVPLDPETRLPVNNRVADQAARFAQSTAIDPEAAAQSIVRRSAESTAEGLPLPTTGLISDDIGLQMLERGLRTKNSTGSILTDPHLDAATKAEFSFGARDNKLRDAAVDKVNALAGDGNPQTFVDRAGEVAQTRIDRANRQLDNARGRERGVQMALQEPANDLTENIGQGNRASQQIDRMYRDTRTAERNQSRALYNDSALVAAEVPGNPLRQIAEQIQELDTAAAPIDPAIRKYVERFAGVRGTDEAGNPTRSGGLDQNAPITMREVNAIRAELEADIKANMTNAEVVTRLRSIKDVVNRYAGELAERGDDSAAAAARAAETNYSERIAPNFRQGAGGRMDTKLKNDPQRQNLPASNTAAEFLTTPEDAADLQRIASLRGNQQETAANARTWLFDRLAQTGVADNGRIDGAKLARWRNVNADIIEQVPGLRAEVDRMVADAQRGAQLSTDAANVTRTADQNATRVMRDVEQGPLGKIRGASPENAAKSIFSSANPERTAQELVETVGKNPEALRGLKAAVADHFAGRVSGVSPANVSDGTQNINYASLVKEFEKNERVLAQIYTPEEMNTLRQAQKLLEPLAKRQGQATTGSVTAESNLSAWRALEAGLKLKFGMLKGGGIMRSLKLATDSLGFNETDQANRLVARMMFDPDLAAHLLTRNVEDAGSPAWNRQLQKLIRVEQSARDINDER